MNELETIRQVLAKTARRRSLAHGLGGLWKGALIGAITLLVVLAAYKIAPFPPEVIMGAGGVVVLGALIGFIYGWSRPVTLLDTARWVDGKKKFQERLSSALEVAASDLD